MKQELASVLVAAASLALSAGCSSAPLSTGQENTSTAAPSGSATPALTSDWVDYPAGPYGTTRGATIENLEFMGWRHPDLANYDVANFEKIRLSDFYDPEGTDVT
jgi:hypothetical protein